MHPGFLMKLDSAYKSLPDLKRFGQNKKANKKQTHKNQKSSHNARAPYFCLQTLNLFDCVFKKVNQTGTYFRCLHFLCYLFDQETGFTVPKNRMYICQKR